MKTVPSLNTREFIIFNKNFKFIFPFHITSGKFDILIVNIHYQLPHSFIKGLYCQIFLNSKYISMTEHP